MTEIASFDVFDTLLTRRVSPPDAIFLGLGRRLAVRGLISLSAEVFARARCEAEHRARGIVPGGEPTLEQVYLEFVWAFELATEIIPALVAEELSAEEEVIVPVPGAVERVARERSSGRKIAFLSDMYLPSTFIGKLLQKHGLMANEDLLMVSCEYGSGKQTGLFEKLFNVAGVKAGQVHHSGNHIGSDITAARRVGVRATHLADANPNRYETILSEHRWATGGASAILAGASRLARLRVPVEDDHSRAIRDVAASVAGPLLTCYVLWVLRHARRSGINRLYFVSRDGQILLKIARRLAPAITPTCELRYLYGSRYAWHLPGMTKIEESEFTWMFEQSQFLSVRSQLDRIGVVAESNIESLEDAGFNRDQWDRNLNRSERERLQQWALSNSIQSQILAESQRKRNGVIQYLQQEGIFEKKPWAVVDVGWRGRLLRSLASISRAGNGIEPVGYYLGLTASKSADSLKRFAYLADRETGCGILEDVRRLTLPIEVFCTADHGTVVGYEKQGKLIQPILRNDSSATATWGLGTLQSAILAFTEELDLAPVVQEADLRRPVVELIKTFWHDPNLAEARAWGAFPFEADHAAENTRPLAREYGVRAVPRVLFHGEPCQPSGPHWWQGSMACTTRWVRLQIRIAGWLHRTANWLWQQTASKPA